MITTTTPRRHEVALQHHGYATITEWTNGEGADVCLYLSPGPGQPAREHTLSLTDDEIAALRLLLAVNEAHYLLSKRER